MANGSLSENQNILIDLPHDGLNTESFVKILIWVKMLV